MKKSNFLRKNFFERPRGITLMSLVVTIIIMLILAGVALRAITTDEGVIDEAKSAKTATEMADLREFVDIAILQAETVHTNAKMEDVIQQLIDNGIIEDASQVDIETGTITVGKNTLDGALADYVITPEEKYYGNKNIVVTNPSYFTFTVDEATGTATITGVKDEYAVKAYQNGVATKYTIVIKDGDKYIKDVVIPYEITHTDGKTYRVTEIGAFAFLGATSSNVEECFTSFVLPNTITKIGSTAFRDCTSLKSINIPECVTHIGNQAFYKCTSLSSINIPNGVTSIEDHLFYRCTSLSSIKLSDSVTSIGNSAFAVCSSLTSINIPDGVTSIGDGAFNECGNLSSINIPDGVTSIAYQTFRYCKSLKEIKIGNNSSLTNIADYAFMNCASLSSINIPNGVTSIGNQAFLSCKILSDIKIPEGVTSIGDSAFNGCTSLNGITLPEGVASIGEQAFRGCESLSSINIPESVTTIGAMAFYGWTVRKTINCEVTAAPSGWNSSWNSSCDAIINWGVSM